MGASSSKQQEQEEQETSTTVGTLSAPLQNMALPKKPRLVLLGTTGAGKSSTGNILLGSKAFKVVIGGLCGPTEVIVKANGDWVVVDTPGMGDIPERMPGISDGEFEQFCKERRQELFINVTKELRQHGGLVLYVLEAGRLLDMKRDHLIAIKEVLSGCFTSSVVLLLTKVPRARQIQQVVEEKQLLGVGNEEQGLAGDEHSAQCFYAWLENERRRVEETCQLRFAEVLGVGLEDDFSETHPAHPRYLQEKVLSIIHGGGNRPPLVGLAPGVALDWDVLVNDRLKQADFIKSAKEAIKNTDNTIANQKEIRFKLRAQQQVLVKALQHGQLTAAGLVVAGHAARAMVAAGNWPVAMVTAQQLACINAKLLQLEAQRGKLGSGMDAEQLRRLVQGP